MHQRYEAVEEAHTKNFASILDFGADADANANSSKEQTRNVWPSDSDKLRREAKRKLWNWVASPGGIFHISGRMGSGKSTLMKLLVESEEMRAKLEEWTGDRAFVLQKSFAGLLRSLLHDALKCCPGLISNVMPETWMRAGNVPWHDQSALEINNKEVRAAFDRLFQQPDHCFYFFIDRLDEFMVDTLNGYREENVFMNNFDAGNRIRLHELTAKDMKQYVEDRLQGIPQQERSFLVSEITSKADGIFLWVTLVVRTVREQIENGIELPDLMTSLLEEES
ncbi:hypothetical protein B0T26DRAFT_738708 [Lasiosphaeria miniovina]|uniref:Nephrocystin 3-like N-terminal domain-containing protein n=1 Tax=Lasiosphaeria miniovina TaxID=1954250 RepID=A0AA40B6R1_9PEZI|nr:uncharacterized protein B0T26DRAFT_738708 [Lasiosphaeria miniovina]KAK0728333.1 hypothetical protein B0T26DRAFT_738708 [Lasiosphaeria miniovina]